MDTTVLEPLKTKTLGPVADLEKHLPSDWWRTLFDSLYLKTDGDVIENDENTFREVDLLLNSIKLSPDRHILDLCCGQGRHVLELQKRGYHNVIGIDRSRYLIRVARKRAQQLNLAIQFSEGDARKIRLSDSTLDCVVMFGNSFGYFESQEDDLSVLQEIQRVLKSQGNIVMDIVNGDWMRHNFEPRSWEWIDETHFVCRERSLSSEGDRIISREVVVHAERGIIADQFYAERLYNFINIKNILESMGFMHVISHGNLVAESTRNQDLGMMANRMFISATAPIKRTKVIGKITKTSLTVLLGDPSLPDIIKRDGKFNEEDFDTIHHLKCALNELNYDVTYLDDHNKFIDNLRSAKPNFVLNLCDEGFNNDALQEMHIPAFLEMLGIPYSGAAPACLALCYNKSIVRSVAQSMDIPVPLETYFDPKDQAATVPSILPALIKPNLGDSSIGITQNAVVHTPEDVVDYLEELKRILPNTAILIQEYLSGAEYSVGVIGNPGSFQVLPILSVDYSNLEPSLPKILGYESKWMPDSPYWNKIKYTKAILDLDAERRLSDYSTMLFERLDCRDYARFDFRADEKGEIKLLEVNPNPGWCWDGKLNLMAQLDNKSYSELLDLIIQAFLDRISRH